MVPSQGRSSANPVQQLVALGEQAAQLASSQWDGHVPSGEDFERERQEVLRLLRELPLAANKAVSVAEGNPTAMYSIDAYAEASARLAAACWQERLGQSHCRRDTREYLAWKVARLAMNDLLNQGRPNRWLTVSEAAQISGCNKGIITKAVNDGKLKGNGLTGRERRIDGVDFNRWQLERAGKSEPSESDEAVKKLVRKHVNDPIRK